MQDIIKPIDRALLKAELTGDKKLGEPTNPIMRYTLSQPTTLPT